METLTNLTPIIELIIKLLAAVAAAFLIPYLKAKISDDKMAQLTFWTETAVSAAEEYFAGPGRGQEKMDYVIRFLRDKGFDVDGSELMMMVNSVVWQLINSWKTEEAPAVKAKK